mmetsp:Transcript_16067/g.47704  ORF Transcript_16067/g.47704 Transcript_16067/m.47704 type:complete len:253 (-) Transcript_16067:1359-2117(-)
MVHRRALVHHANASGVVQDLILRGVEQVLRRVVLALVAVDKLEHEARVGQLGGALCERRVPVGRRVDRLAAGAVQDLAMEVGVLAGDECALAHRHVLRELARRLVEQLVCKAFVWQHGVEAEATKECVRLVGAHGHAHGLAHAHKLPDVDVAAAVVDALREQAHIRTHAGPHACAHANAVLVRGAVNWAMRQNDGKAPRQEGKGAARGGKHTTHTRTQHTCTHKNIHTHNTQPKHLHSTCKHSPHTHRPFTP